MVSSTSALPASASSATQIHYRYKQAGDVNVFYREAGDSTAPVLLMLHGFAGSSFMFRELFSQLADRYHLIAPDLPAFGFTGFRRRVAMHIPLTSWQKPLTDLPRNSISTRMR
jgi:pimeloyl-ACP methyl ester carboxylesterase